MSEKIKDFAWGAAMLAAFHYSILLYFDVSKKRHNLEDKEKQIDEKKQLDEDNPIPSQKTRCSSQLNGPFLPFVVSFSILFESVPNYTFFLSNFKKIKNTGISL